MKTSHKVGAGSAAVINQPLQKPQRAKMTERVSIRYKNPGAMWGGYAISKKWGEAGHQPTMVSRRLRAAGYGPMVNYMCALD